MIKYALRCGDGHAFDAWFSNSAGFDQQVARSHVACPICASTDVSKAIMAPAVVHDERLELSLAGRYRQTAARHAVRDYVMRVTEDVGVRFAGEARKIAEGLSEERPIRGEATQDEAKALLDDGIVILPLPLLPEDFN